MKRILPFIIILVVLGVALGSAWYLTRPIPGSTDTSVNRRVASVAGIRQYTGSATRAASLQGVPGADPAHTLGPANAPVQIEEFGDFRVSAVRNVSSDTRTDACRSLAISCGSRSASFRSCRLTSTRSRPRQPLKPPDMQGKFWEMHDLIYEHQNEWKNAV